MSDPNEGTQGAPGAPAAGAGAAGGSGNLSGVDVNALLTAPDPGTSGQPPADDFSDLKWDRYQAALKAGKVPEDVRREAERPFLQEFTRKNQAFAKEKEQLVNSFMDRLAARGIAPSPEEKDELREKLKESGFPLELVETFIDRKLQPLATDVSSSRMEQLAIAENPAVATKKQEIAQIISGDPSVARLVLANNGRDGHRVIAGIAAQLELAEANEKLKKYEEGLPALKIQIAKDVIAELKRQGASLPPTTSRAGTGPTAGTGPARYETLKEAALAAAKEGNFPL